MSLRQQGFNMVEVLIALVIMAIGLLGIAGLQLTGVRSNQSSYLRSQASSLMADMAERIRNNVPATNNGFYTGLVSGACAAPTICAQENGVAASVCSSQQMATYDFFSVSCGMRGGGGARVDRVTDLLPNGVIRVDCIDNAGAVVAAAANCTAGFRRRITVSWDERTQQSTTGALNVQTQTLTMMVQP